MKFSTCPAKLHMGTKKITIKHYSKMFSIYIRAKSKVSVCDVYNQKSVPKSYAASLLLQNAHLSYMNNYRKF